MAEEIKVDENSILAEKAANIEKLIEVQKNCIQSAYQAGLYNGLVLCRSVLSGGEPEYITYTGDGPAVVINTGGEKIGDSEHK